ncbi:MAG: ATP phosphoribosyltransferase, partial [Caulobacteraceae bacterium]|nr:ATP phosphoribosyltransferase [Caulobacter sp.]
MTDAAPLVLALPSKGRLKAQCEQWLYDCGFKLVSEGGERGYRASIAELPGCEVRLLSAADIAAGLDAGELHLGVTGEDLLRERGEALEARVRLLRA